MTRGQAGDLLALLRAAYPRVAVSADTDELWLSNLSALDAELGRRAVRSLIVGVKFWPSIAELHEHVAIVREHAAREKRERERREADEALERIGRPSLREIPAVVEYLARTSSALDLPEEGRGECSDCGRRSTLYRVGKFRVCLDDVRKRQRAREKLDASGGVAA